MSRLDEPLTLRCGVALPHRVAMAPLTTTQSNSDGTLSEDEYRWLLRRAGSFGLLSTCAAYVSDEGKAWDGQLGVANDEHLPGLSRLASALSEAGSVPVVQLHHAGAKADQAEVKLSTADGEGVRGATEEDIERVIGDFTAAALRAQHAGFAGVEVHGANGYLFTQFLAPKDNPRSDEYGGPLDDRARFLRRTMRAVREAVRPDFAVGVRISPVDHWAKRGLVLADGAQVAAWMAEDGADWVHLSVGDAAGPPPKEDTETPVSRAVRDALPDEVALLAAGGIRTRADAERAESAGVDVVVLGKAAIVHPDWPEASKQPGFAYLPTPWEPDYLRTVDVGPDLLRYISNFPGMVVGGAPARGG